MTYPNTEWAVGSRVLGRFWGDTREPPVLFRVIHRTKLFATLQRADDWSDVHRKKIKRVPTHAGQRAGDWDVRIGPLWLRPLELTPSDPEVEPSSGDASSAAAEPASSSPDPAASE